MRRYAGETRIYANIVSSEEATKKNKKMQKNIQTIFEVSNYGIDKMLQVLVSYKSGEITSLRVFICSGIDFFMVMFSFCSVNQNLSSVADLKVLAGGFERALVAGHFLRRVLAGCRLLQVQGEGRGRLLRRWPAARLGLRRGRGPAVGRHRRR